MFYRCSKDVRSMFDGFPIVVRRFRVYAVGLLVDVGGLPVDFMRLFGRCSIGV